LSSQYRPPQWFRQLLQLRQRLQLRRLLQSPRLRLTLTRAASSLRNKSGTLLKILANGRTFTASWSVYSLHHTRTAIRPFASWSWRELVSPAYLKFVDVAGPKIYAGIALSVAYVSLVEAASVFPSIADWANISFENWIAYGDNLRAQTAHHEAHISNGR